VIGWEVSYAQKSRVLVSAELPLHALLPCKVYACAYIAICHFPRRIILLLVAFLRMSVLPIFFNWN